MPVRLVVGDAVLVKLTGGNKSSKSQQGIGLIRYMGFINGYKMKQYVGIELVEPIPTGHNGVINGYEYFKAQNGHGIHCQFTDIIKKLTSEEIIVKLQEVIYMFKKKLEEYVSAVNERDEYINTLRTSHLKLRNYVKSLVESGRIVNNNSSNSNNKKMKNTNTIQENRNVGELKITTSLQPIKDDSEWNLTTPTTKDIPQYMNNLAKKLGENSRRTSFVGNMTPMTPLEVVSEDEGTFDLNNKNLRSKKIKNKNNIDSSPSMNSVATPLMSSTKIDDRKGTFILKNDVENNYSTFETASNIAKIKIQQQEKLKKFRTFNKHKDSFPDTDPQIIKKKSKENNDNDDDDDNDNNNNNNNNNIVEVNNNENNINNNNQLSDGLSELTEDEQEEYSVKHEKREIYDNLRMKRIKKNRKRDEVETPISAMSEMSDLTITTADSSISDSDYSDEESLPPTPSPRRSINSNNNRSNNNDTRNENVEQSNGIPITNPYLPRELEYGGLIPLQHGGFLINGKNNKVSKNGTLNKSKRKNYSKPLPQTPPHKGLPPRSPELNKHSSDITQRNSYHRTNGKPQLQRFATHDGNKTRNSHKRIGTTNSDKINKKRFWPSNINNYNSEYPEQFQLHEYLNYNISNDTSNNNSNNNKIISNRNPQINSLQQKLVYENPYLSNELYIKQSKNMNKHKQKRYDFSVIQKEYDESHQEGRFSSTLANHSRQLSQLNNYHNYNTQNEHWVNGPPRSVRSQPPPDRSNNNNNNNSNNIHTRHTTNTSYSTINNPPILHTGNTNNIKLHQFINSNKHERHSSNMSQSTMWTESTDFNGNFHNNNPNMGNEYVSVIYESPVNNTGVITYQY